jgi:hypothetical protein
MQATLLAAYFVFQYGVVIYYLVMREKERRFESTSELTDFINTLFRQQSQLFGKVVFLTVYAFVITFSYLPASLVDNNLATTLASTYVIDEKEKKQVERLRGEAIGRVRMLSAGVVSHLVHAKKEVFCIDAALKFCNMVGWLPCLLVSSSATLPFASLLRPPPPPTHSPTLVPRSTPLP